MEFFHIALLQIAPCDGLAENLEKGIRFCKQAKAMGADLALFPEMWSNGYRIYNRPVAQWAAEAVPAGGGFVGAFQSLAKELNMAVGITLLEQYEPAPRNTLILFDRFGKRAFTYAKVHTCDFDVERNLTPGEDFYVASLDTARGEIKVGAMICYDREFPESARILMLKGAELILVPNACPMEINRLPSFAPEPLRICWPSRPAIIRIRSRIATAAPAYSTGWPIFRSRTAPGIPVSCRPAARRGFIWRGWICSSCAGTARRRSTAMHTGVRNGTACWWTPRGGSPSSGRITGGKGRGRGPSRSAEPEKIWLESIRGIWYNMFNFSSIQA